VEQNYGRGRLYSLGVEEEFQIVRRESYELVSRIDEILLAFDDDEEHEGRVKAELLQSTVEIATNVAATVAEAAEDLTRLRARVRDVAAESDSLIAAAGTHPFSRYEHQDVHVGLDSPDKAIACANSARTFLPELLAASVNSPFWQGRPTGLASTRTKVFDAFPRSGLPPAFSSFEEFELLVDRAVKTNSFPDYTYIWWDLRPHPRLGTIELRVCDAQTRMESVVAIVALVQSLVATLAEAWENGDQPSLQPITLVAENKWRAARYGLGAQLIDLENDTERPAPEALRALVERCEPAAQKLGCAGELAAIESLLERGSGADEQLRCYEESGSLLAVAQWLAAETVREL
jgi:carboxylate-amine ligase